MPTENLSRRSIWSRKHEKSVTRRGRADHSELINRIIQLLLLPENADHIRQAVSSDDRKLARIALRLCIENELVEKPVLVAKYLAHPDVAIRRRISGLLRDFANEELEPMLRIAVRDHHMPVRREAFQLCLQRFPETGIMIANQLLFDRHASIREIAMRPLNAAGIDVAAIYVGVLLSAGESVPRLQAALFGIGALNAKSRIGLVERFVASKIPKLRAAALFTLTKLDANIGRPKLIQGLGDPSPGVAKECLRILRAYRLRPTLAELNRVIDESKYSHTVKIVIRAARQLGKWDRLIFLLAMRSMANEDTAVSDIWGKEFANRLNDFNRSAMMPNEDQKEIITTLFDRNLHLLSETERLWISITVKGFRDR